MGGLQDTSTDAPWIGPGSASPPTDEELSRQYVNRVVTRYGGRITGYETGNEPNMPMFWTGTAAQYRRLTEIAAEELDQIDPEATIVAQAGLVRRPKGIAAVARYAKDISAIDEIDVVSVHLYPRGRRLDEAADLTVPARAAVGTKPSWVTEVNVSRAGTLNSKQQKSAVTQLTQQIQQAGFARAYWYS